MGYFFTLIKAVFLKLVEIWYFLYIPALIYLNLFAESWWMIALMSGSCLFTWNKIVARTVWSRSGNQVVPPFLLWTLSCTWNVEQLTIFLWSVSPFNNLGTYAIAVFLPQYFSLTFCRRAMSMLSRRAAQDYVHIVCISTYCFSWHPKYKSVRWGMVSKIQREEPPTSGSFSFLLLHMQASLFFGFV